MTEEWYSSIIEPFLQKFVEFVPRLILAVIVFVIGYIISVAIGKLVAEILRKLKLNRLFEKEGWRKALERAELKVDPSGFIGVIFKWIFIIISLLLAADILRLVGLTDLLKSILAYIPNVIIAVLIFVVTVIIADIVEKIVRARLEGVKFSYARIGGGIVKWSIWVFAILMILYQLGIGRIFMADLFRGIVAMIVIAIGLSFGLGGKEVAAEILQDLRRKLKE